MTNPVAERPRSFIEAFKGRDPRLLFFYFALAMALSVLAGGLLYQQLLRQDEALEKEKFQSQIRVVVPGPRGNLYDREGRLLVGNRPRFAAVLNLDELRHEFRREYLTVRRAYRQNNDKDLPNETQISHIARFTVVDRYLQQVNRALGRDATVDAQRLQRHFAAKRLLPYTLIDDLKPEEYARLLEQLPVNSPLQVYVSSVRYYPYKSAAAHVLGYVSIQDDVEVTDDFPGEGLPTFKLEGSVGKNGLEAKFDPQLQGESGGTIYRIDPARYRVAPLTKRLPIQGNNLVSSLDIDLQLAAEEEMELTELKGSAVAMDIATGEVLVMSSKPDYDLNLFAPRLSATAAKDIEERGAWLNRAIQGVYPPGSSFKILVAIAGLRAGVIQPQSSVNCTGYYAVGRRLFPCHDGHAHHEIALPQAIARSCNVFFYAHGIEMGPEVIANEARRFGFGKRTGIELPHESGRTLVPDPAWRREARDLPWTPGDTANVSIGQGEMQVTPLQMAAFTASFARREVHTQPSLIHLPNRPRQRSAPIGLSDEEYAAIVRGMEEVTKMPSGTARSTFDLPRMRIPNLRVAGKTGTAQQRSPEGTINFAWFICFAPVEDPQIAIAVAMEGDTPGEEAGGGTFAAPIARAILKKWWEKRAATPAQSTNVAAR